MIYDLWYWDGIPGRGEFVRLALEAGGIPYRECAREPDADESTLVEDLSAPRKHPPFAPPYLVAGKMTLGQTANILLFLGEKHGLAPESVEAPMVNQLQSPSRTWWPKRTTRIIRSPPASITKTRRKRRPGARAASAKSGCPSSWDMSSGCWRGRGPGWRAARAGLMSTCPCSIWSTGRFTPSRSAWPPLAATYPNVMALHARVAGLAELQPYFGSGRRLPFGEGIFRRYRELDAA